uniref:Obtusifoliol 14-alpha demethylase n=1 Tax=Aegilops tauschii TaxID=37682 RepID=N1QWA6_AEGTA
MELATVNWVAYVVPIAVTTTIIISAMMARRRRRRAERSPCARPPPVAAGAPLVGVLPWLLAKGPLQVIRDAHAELGSVFTVRLLHREVTFLVGPDVPSHFYQGLDSEVSQDEVSRFTIPTFGPGVAFDVDLATRREQIRFFGDAMKPAKLRTYAGLMVREVEEYFTRWGESGMVDLKQELELLVTLVASRCLFGEEVRSKMLREAATHLRELNDGMRLVTILFPHLPIPAHRRRDRARARLGEIFSDMVRSRREAGRPVDDMLQCLIDSSFTVRTREGDEYEVPAGRTIASPLLIHNRLPQVYRDPERYEPGRFCPGRGEDGAGGAFSYTAFGGGRHACVGEAFAYMQIKVIWSHLLRNFEMEMVSPFPETDWNVVMPGPKGKVMLRYKRRNMSPTAKITNPHTRYVC